MARNIFIEKDIVCPACKTGIHLKYPNPKLYAAAGRDEDQRVTSYSWAGGLTTDVLPHHYAVFQCANCLLADLRENFENPTHGPKDRAAYTVLQTAPFENRLILRKLRRFVPGGPLDAQGALALHLAAIYIVGLPAEKETVDHLKLGRLYLRLSWLYKEQTAAVDNEVGETAGDSSSTTGKLLMVLEQFQQVIRQVFSENLELIQQLTDARASELKIPAERNPYVKLTAGMRDKMGHMQQALLGLQETAMQDNKGKLTPAAAAGALSDISLEKFIPTLLPQWPRLPRTEKDAVKSAVEAFDYSARYEDANQSLQQSMSLTNLIIKLLLKINDLERALNYIMQIFKTGYRDKQDLQMKFNQAKRAKTLKPIEEKQMTKQIGAVTRTLTMAAENRRKVVGMIYERDKEKIMAVLEQHAEKTAEEQAQAITDAGLTEELIPWLRENNLMKSEEDTKKKWFGKK